MAGDSWLLIDLGNVVGGINKQLSFSFPADIMDWRFCKDWSLYMQDLIKKEGAGRTYIK